MPIADLPSTPSPADELLALIGRAMRLQREREALKGPTWGGPAPASEELLGIVREMGSCVRRWAGIDPGEAQRLGSELLPAGDDARFAASFGAFAALCSWEARGADLPLDALWGDTSKLFKGVDSPHWSWHGRCRMADMPFGKDESEKVLTTFARMAEKLPPRSEDGPFSLPFKEAMAAVAPGWACERGPSARGLQALGLSVGRAVDRQRIAQAAAPAQHGNARRQAL